MKQNKISKIIIIENIKENEFYVAFFASLLSKTTYTIGLDTPKKEFKNY